MRELLSIRPLDAETFEVIRHRSTDCDARGESHTLTGSLEDARKIAGESAPIWPKWGAPVEVLKFLSR